MKTIKLSLIITSLFVFSAFSSNAQSNTDNKHSSTITTAGNPDMVKTDYMNVGIENQIKEHLISGEIPSSFPKYTEGDTQEEYLEIMKDWAKKNITLIKKEYHRKVMTDQKN